jgi:hypothetical protein
VRAIIETAALTAEQLDEGFVHERGRIQRLRARLTPALNPRGLEELVVDERKQPTQRALITAAHVVE